ncbi:MAG: tetratricopeptide repeat protein [Kiloniellaceae bacterium]
MNRRERRRLKTMRRRDDLDSGRAAYDVRATLQRALAFLQAGQPQEALRLYRQVLKIHPDHADALNLSGIAAFQLGNIERALELIRKAVAARPDHVDANNNLGNVLKASGRLDEAEAAYRRALEIMPEYVGGHFNLGIVLEALDRPDEAEAAYRRALELRPDFAEACLNRGNALKTVGRLHEAIGAFRQALEMAPDHADGHNNHGSALREIGKLDEAAAAYRRALEIEPRHVDAHYNLGIALQEQEKLDEAITAYRRALEIDPAFAGAWVNLGYALQKSGRLDEAIDAYRRAIEIVPDYPGAHVNLGDALLERGDAAAAAAACEAYLEGHPGDTAILAWKAIVLHELGERESARTLVDFDRFIRPVHLEAPPPFSSLAEFNAALADHVSRHPTLVYAPARHATRFGKHSGELLAEPKGPVAHLEEKIREAVEVYIRSLPVDRGHPFLNNPPRRFGLTAWCIILEGQGHQVPHIHPSAWLSGVYYVRLPETIGQPGQGEAGWIEFGRPPEHFHCTVEPEVRVFRPEQGLMLLFPSYFYHRTVPFESTDVRVSISFDVLPEA